MRSINIKKTRPIKACSIDTITVIIGAIVSNSFFPKVNFLKNAINAFIFYSGATCCVFIAAIVACLLASSTSVIT